MSSKDRGGVVAPDDGVGREIPDEGRLAERGQDGRGREACVEADAGAVRIGCHGRLVSGHCRVILRRRIGRRSIADPRQSS